MKASTTLVRKALALIIPSCKDAALMTCAILLGLATAGYNLSAADNAPAPKPVTGDQKPAAKAGSAAAESTPEPAWKSLFDGKTLTGWKITDFGGQGEVKVENGRIILDMGNNATGITWTNDVLKMNYEISLDAMRVEGSDFFCGLTFPVKDDPCTLILGGWGGGLVGLSCLDGNDASSNETTKMMAFENGRWYHVRLRVTPEKIEAWLDKDKIIDANIKDRRISVRIEVELSKPLGICTWITKAALRNIKVRPLPVDTSSAQ